MCPGCSTLIHHDNNDIQKTVSHSLEKFNNESELANRFALLKIFRAAAGMALSTYYNVEFSIQETICPNSAEATAEKCPLMNCEFAHKGFCMTALYHCPTNEMIDVDCEIYEPEAAEREKKLHLLGEETDHSHNDTHSHSHDQDQTHDHAHDHTKCSSNHGHTSNHTDDRDHHHTHDHATGSAHRHAHDHSHDHGLNHDHVHTHHDKAHNHSDDSPSHHHDYKHAEGVHTHEHDHELALDHDHKHGHLHEHECYHHHYKHIKYTYKISNALSRAEWLANTKMDDDVRAYVNMVISALPVAEGKMELIRAETSKDETLQTLRKTIIFKSIGTSEQNSL
ncbi:cadmium/zinc-transporting ATPase HMA2-like [Neolamprologus brichardi]|uniref:cadmium/zinc-transporting ATPase HMA2-like n=1 Tax=Neolamprologus brichardi TaxID=32507 RepID=UPI001643D739|nr:cadmium/zinc-transporting ATPase HMA2-like [Neolamprologus brichardi]